jgi:hypothetical protein
VFDRWKPFVQSLIRFCKFDVEWTGLFLGHHSRVQKTGNYCYNLNEQICQTYSQIKQLNKTFNDRKLQKIVKLTNKIEDLAIFDYDYNWIKTDRAWLELKRYSSGQYIFTAAAATSNTRQTFENVPFACHGVSGSTSISRPTYAMTVSVVRQTYMWRSLNVVYTSWQRTNMFSQLG